MPTSTPTVDSSRGEIEKALDDALKGGVGPKAARFALAVLSGAIPLGGGIVGGIAGAWSEQEQKHFNQIFAAWLKLQEDEIREIGLTLFEIMARVDLTDERVRERIESPEYLRLIKKSFRDWSAAESEEKRKLIRNLLANAAATRITSDDVVSMFIQWIELYSEGHFKVVTQIFQNPGITRFQLWQNINGNPVREDSAEADLFKLLIQDLATGHVIRQHREKDYQGNFIKTQTRARTPRRPGSPYTSAFEDDKQYELTELGRQFISYAMNELVPRISSGKSPEGTTPNT